MLESNENISSPLLLFQNELGRIVRMIGTEDETALDIKNPHELDEDDMQLWQETKDLLLAVDGLEAIDDQKQVNEQLYALSKRAMSLQDAVTVASNDVKRNSSTTKHNFYGWLNNRNPLSVISMGKYMLDKKGPLAAVEYVKNKLRQEIGMYVKNASKN